AGVSRSTWASRSTGNQRCSGSVGASRGAGGDRAARIPRASWLHGAAGVPGRAGHADGDRRSDAGGDSLSLPIAYDYPSRADSMPDRLSTIAVERSVYGEGEVKRHAPRG